MRRVHVSIEGRVQGVFFGRPASNARGSSARRLDPQRRWMVTSRPRRRALHRGRAMWPGARKGPPHASVDRVDVREGIRTGETGSGSPDSAREKRSSSDAIARRAALETSDTATRPRSEKPNHIPVSIAPSVPPFASRSAASSSSRTRRTWNSSRASPSSSVPTGRASPTSSTPISWVLGEQGARALRGAQMADVIFAGTPTRPALGMAEVKLVIDNTAGQDPRADDRDRGLAHGLPSGESRVPHQGAGRPAAGRAGAALRDRASAAPPHRGGPGPARRGPSRPPRGAAQIHRGGRRHRQAPAAQGASRAQARPAWSRTSFAWATCWGSSSDSSSRCSSRPRWPTKHEHADRRGRDAGRASWPPPGCERSARDASAAGPAGTKGSTSARGLGAARRARRRGPDGRGRLAPGPRSALADAEAGVPAGHASTGPGPSGVPRGRPTGRDGRERRSSRRGKPGRAPFDPSRTSSRGWRPSSPGVIGRTRAFASGSSTRPRTRSATPRPSARRSRRSAGGSARMRAGRRAEVKALRTSLAASERERERPRRVARPTRERSPWSKAGRAGLESRDRDASTTQSAP